MIEIITDGDIFESDAQALVNPVNCQGISGKGLALEFRSHFPYNYVMYQSDCRNKHLKIGTVSICRDDHKYIINFPTKDHWKDPSKIAYIEEGLHALKDVIILNKITSIAIPKLGCGLGGLNWEEVKPLIIKTMSEEIFTDIRVVIYE